jgi:thioredoxin reductase (NADPH)
LSQETNRWDHFYEDKGSLSKTRKNLEIKESLSRAVETLFRLSIFLADIASEVTLIHRRNEFRGVRFCRVQELKDLGKIRLITQLRLWV